MIIISEELIEKAGHGDRQAFEAIYHAYARFVYGTALRITGNRQDAEEVTQDVFMKVYEHVHGFDGKKFSAWVYRITFNEAINLYHKRKKQKGRQTSFVQEHEDAVTVSPDHAVLDAQYYERKVHALVSRLAPEYQVCIMLREIEGLEYQEIADVVGVPVNTVRSRLKRGREALIRIARKEVASYEL